MATARWSGYLMAIEVRDESGPVLQVRLTYGVDQRRPT